jgi:hypothetical protein
MSDLAQTATTIWAMLVKALRADGLIANAITHPGQNTTQVLLQLAHDNHAKEGHVVWTPHEIAPSIYATLWTRHFDLPDEPGQVVKFCETRGHWINVHTGMRPRRFTHYILLPDIGKPLEIYRAPEVRPEAEFMDP